MCQTKFIGRLHIRHHVWPDLLRNAVLFTLVWWILVEGATASWWIGVPAVLLAAAISVAIISPIKLVWFQLLRFVPFFLIRSLLGGADVAWRAFHPGMPIDPQEIKYRVALPPGLPFVFMANTVSLLPGTLSVELTSSFLRVHVLSSRKNILAELARLEEIVAALFGISMPLSGGAGR